MSKEDKTEYGLLTLMGGKLDKDLTEVNKRLTSIEEKLDMLLSRSSASSNYVVEIPSPPASHTTLTGILPEIEPEGSD